MKTITKESLFELNSLSQPISVGNIIFFMEHSINKESNQYESRIYSVDKQTKERRLWSGEETSISQLKISPNKKWLSYVSKVGKKLHLKIQSLDGGSAYSLMQKDSFSDYIWNESSSAIYFVQTKSTDEKKEEKILEQPKRWNKLIYKLDGAGLLDLNATYQLSKIMLATKEESILFETTDEINLTYVSKDESYVLLGRDKEPQDEWDYGSTLYKYDLSTKSLMNLTESLPKGSFYYGKMNPTEEDLLLVGNTFEYGFVTQNKLYHYDMKSGFLTCLTESLDEEVGDAIVGDFQQQVRGVDIDFLTSDTFIFPVTHHGKIVLYKGDFDGNLKKIYDEKNHLTDAYLTGSELIVTYSTLIEPSVLATLSLEDVTLKTVYNPNELILKDMILSTPQEFWYESEEDVSVQGWYVPPVLSEKQHPAVLYIHGGPQVCYGETFFHEMQYHAANGYGVIMLNPRGGQGYGQEFVSAILGDYGNKDYTDLMVGLDAVLTEHPEIDEKKLVVAGGSYGGFMTNWIVGHSKRFQAAVTQRSISNWISFYGTSDIGAFFVKYQLLTDLPNISDMWKLSPLAYVEHGQTPLLVLHGEDDLRCPKEQGEQMYTAMKRFNVPTEMVVYPKSSHGLSRGGLPHLRLARLTDISSWFDKHLNNGETIK
ncbi:MULTISPECIES: S9 family peptidase [unclassified Vagococcus]|uniref:alpha/beta hydrolase family protein n=1 Tax=unclassified Vagococcus TaxID=2648499 RepID=UPI001F507ACF|nr:MULTISPECIES: S9 family peptidase [unclassified Vagococcus]MCI0130177.1 S9 family peptidase [Vagococcus sp. CY53-2]UNM89001.1 S9 family peptidase [Vagococcus sp. CY52-2]